MTCSTPHGARKRGRRSPTPPPTSSPPSRTCSAARARPEPSPPRVPLPRTDQTQSTSLPTSLKRYVCVFRPEPTSHSYDDWQLLRPEVERHAPWWSWLGAVCGAGLGFIIANVPGLMVGVYVGNRLGAIRDAKGKSVAAVFSQLGGNQKAEVRGRVSCGSGVGSTDVAYIYRFCGHWRPRYLELPCDCRPALFVVGSFYTFRWTCILICLPVQLLWTSVMWPTI